MENYLVTAHTEIIPIYKLNATTYLIQQKHFIAVAIISSKFDQNGNAK